jgi:hypothetical protein
MAGLEAAMRIDGLRLPVPPSQMDQTGSWDVQEQTFRPAYYGAGSKNAYKPSHEPPPLPPPSSEPVQLKRTTSTRATSDECRPPQHQSVSWFQKGLGAVKATVAHIEKHVNGSEDVDTSARQKEHNSPVLTHSTHTSAVSAKLRPTTLESNASEPQQKASSASVTKSTNAPAANFRDNVTAASDDVVVNRKLVTEGLQFMLVEIILGTGALGGNETFKGDEFEDEDTEEDGKVS